MIDCYWEYTKLPPETSTRSPTREFDAPAPPSANEVELLGAVTDKSPSDVKKTNVGVRTPVI